MTSPAQDIARIEVAVVTDADMIAAQANQVAKLEAALKAIRHITNLVHLSQETRLDDIYTTATLALSGPQS